MATLKGVWVWNETIALPTFISLPEYGDAPIRIQDVNYTTLDTNANVRNFTFFAISHQSSIHPWYDMYAVEGYTGYTMYDFVEAEWLSENYRTVDFGKNEQEVSDEFYEWFTANATQQTDEEETPQIVSITYGGAELTTLGADETVSLHTSEKRMTGDVEVTITAKDYDGSVVVEGEPNELSYVPAEIATEAEMTALLDTADVGSVYKYTGETATYENGALYVVEESE